ncbi:MAG: hypothetical protein GXO45_04195 [Aquificae bacterium]|nr:hypothetical protein [Aquificota bacterium]
MRRFVFVLLFIGALFYTFHDYVYYVLDGKPHIVHTQDCGNKNCQFHENLHIPGVLSINQPTFLVEFTDSYTFTYKKPTPHLYIKEIFKPPRTISL